MSGKEKIRKRKGLLKRPHRLVIIDERRYLEVFSQRGTILQFLFILLGCVLLFFVLAYVVLRYTPVGDWVVEDKGYIKQKELLRLREKVLSMEYTIRSQNLYILKIRSLLSGKPEEELELASVLDSGIRQDFVKVDRVREDDSLRKMVDDGTIWEGDDVMDDRANEDQTSTLIEGMTFFVPIYGTISSSFDVAANHYGTDITAPKNTAVKSILDGTVIYSDWSRETGNSIYIQHENNLISVYKHNSVLLKSVGDRVTAGEAIAIIGNTGTHTTGPHVHIEIWRRGTPIDPEQHIKFE